jgi:hypothetical protein
MLLFGHFEARHHRIAEQHDALPARGNGHDLGTTQPHRIDLDRRRKLDRKRPRAAVHVLRSGLVRPTEKRIVLPEDFGLGVDRMQRLETHDSKYDLEGKAREQQRARENGDLLPDPDRGVSKPRRRGDQGFIHCV